MDPSQNYCESTSQVERASLLSVCFLKLIPDARPAQISCLTCNLSNDLFLSHNFWLNDSLYRAEGCMIRQQNRLIINSLTDIASIALLLAVLPL